jgi:hypothetical protein
MTRALNADVALVVRILPTLMKIEYIIDAGSEILNDPGLPSHCFRAVIVAAEVSLTHHSLL